METIFEEEIITVGIMWHFKNYKAVGLCVYYGL
jgi:hypothetical protein